MNLKNKVVIILGLLVLLGIGFKKVIDFQDYNPTVIIETNKFQCQDNKELLKGNKIIDQFRANNNNLGIISVLFNTHSRINDDYLQFNIKEVGSNKWYYSNKYKVDQFQDNQYFPFGFPEINNSKGKTYKIEIESLNGMEGNSVQVLIKNKVFLSKYSFPKAYLLQNKKEIPIFILSKIGSFFGHISLNVYLFILLIVYLLRLININKLLYFLKKISKFITNSSNLLFIKIKNSKLTIPILIVICILGLFIINLWLNWPVRLKAFAFGDDLGSWEFFNTNRNNFFGFIFNTGANKFRPIFLSVFFVVLSLIGNKIWLFGIFNLIFNFLITIVLFFLIRKISRSVIISFCLSVAFIFSRFAYYDITQALGLMEAMALLLSIVVIYLLWRYLNTENIKYFWTSLLVFTMLIFTHERFITILGVYFVLFLILGLKKKNILLFLLSTTPVILSFILKIFVLQIRALDGTGGTNILQTFNISAFFQFFLSGWFYIFGVNAGPSYLNGISSEAVPQNINTLILIGNICLLLITVFFGILILKSKKILSKKYINNFILFFSFILLTLVAGSVTFRLEMRWLYASFVGLLFLLAYIFRVILKQNIFGKICLFLIILWLVIFIQREMFYRTYYIDLYYWSIQSFGNSLYEATIKKYDNNFLNNNIYILCGENTTRYIVGCNDYVDSNLFFRQYGNFQKGNIKFTSNINEIANDNKGIILYYDRQQNRFIETKIGDNLKEAILISGWYEWDAEHTSLWTSENTDAWFTTGNKGKMIFQGYIPKYNSPNKISFFIDGKRIKSFDIKEGNIKIEMETPKNMIIDLKFNVEYTKSPVTLGISPDIRELGVLVYNINFF